MEKMPGMAHLKKVVQTKTDIEWSSQTSNIASQQNGIILNYC